MIEAYGTEAVYAAEESLMATLEDGELMERAVEGLAAVAAARLAARGGATVVGLIGPGNNGADALFALARLAEAGFVAVGLHHDTVHAGARAAAEASGVVMTTEAAAVAEADLVLDGVLGIGARPGLPTWAQPWVDAVPDEAYVLAVDLPSGQDPAGGELDARGVMADETVTFSVAKPVHLLPPTEQACGVLTVVEIGVAPEGAPVVRRFDHDDVARRWPVPGPGDDKYSRGVVGIVAGGESFTGAALLCTTAAVEAGAGMVRYVGTPTSTGLVRAHVPEATHGVGRVQAWVIGPGLDTSSRATGSKAQLDVARDALAGDEPVVLDAGGLDLLDASVIRRRGERVTLLTPHAGECARLLARLGGASVQRAAVEAAPVEHARRLAGLTGATVLLKGATTLVVPPGAGAPVWSQADAPAWLATAGAGDVLAGLLGMLVAAGLPADEAGALGALVHGVAAERANPGGPVRALGVAHALGATVAALLRR